MEGLFKTAKRNFLRATSKSYLDEDCQGAHTSLGFGEEPTLYFDDTAVFEISALLLENEILKLPPICLGQCYALHCSI
jgi:hypothetical protein